MLIHKNTRRIISTTTVLFSIIILFACNKDKIIPQNQMAEIISKMYLADQYIEQNPILNAQKDTNRVYEAIFNSYGYSKSDYFNSTKYYLGYKDSYKTIHFQAKQMLAKRLKELTIICKNSDINLVPWWLTDTIKTLNQQQLEANYKFRALKWLAMPHIIFNWKFTDSIQLDFPSNANWWVNNLKQDSTKFSISLYIKGQIDSTYSRSTKKINLSDNVKELKYNKKTGKLPNIVVLKE